MRNVSTKFERQLQDLAELLVRPERYGDLALQDTVEFEPVILEFPGGLKLKSPPEHGWELPPAA